MWVAGVCEGRNKYRGSTKGGEFLEKRSNYQLIENDSSS
jgi:hypothetical protein